MMYGVFFRIIWSMCISWIIYACHNNMGGNSPFFLQNIVVYIQWKQFINIDFSVLARLYKDVWNKFSLFVIINIIARIKFSKS